MTNKEIIKALECCDQQHKCNECPYLMGHHLVCNHHLHKDTLNLINRQQAEIERLKAGVNVDIENYASEYDSKIKSEAIKNFVELLKENANNWNELTIEQIEQLAEVEGMVGDNNVK